MNYLLRLTPSDIQIRGMDCPHSLRHPLFRRRWFADDVIITCVRWYLRFKLSYRDLAELARELGVSVAPSTILRWVVRYVPEFEKCWQAYERPVGDSWRVKSRVAPMLGFKRFFNARRVLSGVELVHKIIKGQFGLPESFGTEPFHVWYNVLAA